jgi:hypothetical protein
MSEGPRVRHWSIPWLLAASAGLVVWLMSLKDVYLS